MYKESVAAPVPYDSSIAGFTFDFMKKKKSVSFSPA